MGAAGWAAAADRDGSRRCAELLAAIYDAPDDRALRQVYADALLEAGDPRGELIAIQCAGPRADAAARRRERALLAAHGTAWLGAIAPVVRRRGAAFRGGFLAVAREHRRLGRADLGGEGGELLAAREWRTVEEIDLSERGELAVAFLRRPLPVLRRVWGVQLADVSRALARVTAPWVTLGLSSLHGLALAPALERLPLLTELDLAALPIAEALEAVRALRAAGALRVRLCVPPWQLGAQLAAALALGAAELELVPAPEISLTYRGECARLVGARLVGGAGRGAPGSYGDAVCRALARIAPAARAGSGAARPGP